MFPKTLLSIKFKTGTVKPKYLFDSEQVEQVISIFKECKGKKLKYLKREITRLECESKNYKLIRALAELIKRRCEFSQTTGLDPLEVRKTLFEKGFVIDKEKRDSIISSTAKDFGVSKEEIENAIFADLPEEQQLKEINPITSEGLLRKYNLSATQTLLFNATEMIFTVGDNYQQIFRTINYLGLMYETDGMEIRVIGPVSLLKNTKKYGSSLAKLIPYIIKSINWAIEAKIKMERGNEPRIFTFKLNSSDNIPFPVNNEAETKFDSKDEEQFYNDLSLYASDWEIRREPTFIKAGNHVIIPDFGFYKNGMKVFLEIVGFWTQEYIQKKIKNFNQTDTKIIVAVNQNLKCSRADFPGDVIFYKKRIPIKPILDILKREEERKIKHDLDSIQTIKIDDDIINLKTKAKELNVSIQVLEQINIPGYYIIGQSLVSKDFLDKLKVEIGEKRKFLEIKKILDKYQLTDKALELIGYKIIWNGLIPLKIIEINCLK